MSRHMTAPGVWADDGAQSPYTAHVTVGASALVNAVPLRRSPDVRQYAGVSPWHAIHRAEYNARRREQWRRERHGL